LARILEEAEQLKDYAESMEPRLIKVNMVDLEKQRAN